MPMVCVRKYLSIKTTKFNIVAQQMRTVAIFHLRFKLLTAAGNLFLKYEGCPGNCKFAVSRASPIFQKRFPDADSCLHGPHRALGDTYQHP